SSVTCAAAFSPTDSLASAAWRAATSGSLRSPARAAGSIRPARRDGCRGLPRTWSIASYRAFRCASGCSLPRWARFLLARDPALITRTLHLALRGIFARQWLRARRLGVRGTRAGAVTFVQRFGSALNLNVHFHCVVPDGVWVREEGFVRFVPLPGLIGDDVAQVLRSLERRIGALLKPRLAASREDARPPDALAASQAESVSALRGKPPDASTTRVFRFTRASIRTRMT